MSLPFDSLLWKEQGPRKIGNAPTTSAGEVLGQEAGKVLRGVCAGHVLGAAGIAS